jgi:hypothetical protein
MMLGITHRAKFYFKPKKKIFLQSIDVRVWKEKTIIVKRLIFNGDVRINDPSAVGGMAGIFKMELFELTNF